MRCKGTFRFWSSGARAAFDSVTVSVEGVLVHQLRCFILIRCSDLSPAFSMEPLMRNSIENSPVVYVDSPREAHTAFQTARGLVT